MLFKRCFCHKHLEFSLLLTNLEVISSRSTLSHLFLQLSGYAMIHRFFMWLYVAMNHLICSFLLILWVVSYCSSAFDLVFAVVASTTVSVINIQILSFVKYKVLSQKTILWNPLLLNICMKSLLYLLQLFFSSNKRDRW